MDFGHETHIMTGVVQLVFHPIIRTCRAIYCSGNSFLGQQARVAREIRRGTRIVSKMEGGEGEGNRGRPSGAMPAALP